MQPKVGACKVIDLKCVRQQTNQVNWTAEDEGEVVDVRSLLTDRRPVFFN